MYSFALQRPTTLAAAAEVVARGGQPMAGGQTLLASLKQRLANPELLVDLSGIAELQGIDCTPQRVTIGAMTRHQTVAAHAGVNATIPGLARLAGGIGDRQVRAMGTIGGSVANNDPAADYPAGVLGLDGTVVTNKRRITSADFFTGMYETALQPGELITSISFPVPKRAGYAKFPNPASRFALVGVFVSQAANGSVRVAVTGAGPGVFRVAEMEKALAANFSVDAIAGVKLAADGLNTDIHADAEYRAHLIGVMARRAVAAALA